MKIANKLLIFFALCHATISCSVEDTKAFDAENSYIYFNMPFVHDAFNNETLQRHDSLVYSFAFDNATIKSHTINVPIGVIGAIKDVDREYRIAVVKEKTTAESSDWEESSLKNAVVKKGQLFTDLNIKINRSSSLKTNTRYIVLRIIPNENFMEGDKGLLEVKLIFSDILMEPNWWKTYLRFFGPYQKEIYAKWRDIYALGSDSGLSYDNDKPLYWDNMPGLFIISWYPILGMKIRVLKQYFIDNEVYPDGDTSKERILLP